MLDYGEKALEETLEYLNAAGIKYAGAGRSKKRPIGRCLNVMAKKIAFYPMYSYILQALLWQEKTGQA